MIQHIKDWLLEREIKRVCYCMESLRSEQHFYAKRLAFLVRKRSKAQIARMEKQKFGVSF